MLSRWTLEAPPRSRYDPCRHPGRPAAEHPADLSVTHVQASQALKRASRGGMLTGLQLASISSLLIGASRLKRAIQGAVRSAEDSGASATFEPLVDAIKVCRCTNMARMAGGHGCVMHVMLAGPPLSVSR